MGEERLRYTPESVYWCGGGEGEDGRNGESHNFGSFRRNLFNLESNKDTKGQGKGVRVGLTTVLFGDSTNSGQRR